MSGLYAGIFCDGVEAGTGLADVRQVAVSHDAGSGMIRLQAAEQPEQGPFLGGCAGVGRLAVGIEASFVADA